MRRRLGKNRRKGRPRGPDGDLTRQWPPGGGPYGHWLASALAKAKRLAPPRRGSNSRKWHPLRRIVSAKQTPCWEADFWLWAIGIDPFERTLEMAPEMDANEVADRAREKGMRFFTRIRIAGLTHAIEAASTRWLNARSLR